MEENKISIDYEGQCKHLEKEISRIREEYEMKLKYAEEQKIDDERKLNEENKWLRNVINSILHI